MGRSLTFGITDSAFWVRISASVKRNPIVPLAPSGQRRKPIAGRGLRPDGRSASAQVSSALTAESQGLEATGRVRRDRGQLASARVRYFRDWRRLPCDLPRKRAEEPGQAQPLLGQAQPLHRPSGHRLSRLALPRVNRTALRRLPCGRLAGQGQRHVPLSGNCDSQTW